MQRKVAFSVCFFNWSSNVNDVIYQREDFSEASIWRCEQEKTKLLCQLFKIISLNFFSAFPFDSFLLFSTTFFLFSLFFLSAISLWSLKFCVVVAAMAMMSSHLILLLHCCMFFKLDFPHCTHTKRIKKYVKNVERDRSVRLIKILCDGNKIIVVTLKFKSFRFDFRLCERSLCLHSICGCCVTVQTHLHWPMLKSYQIIHSLQPAET